MGKEQRKQDRGRYLSEESFVFLSCTEDTTIASNYLPFIRDGEFVLLYPTGDEKKGPASLYNCHRGAPAYSKSRW